MGKFNKLSIIIITLMVCIFGSLIVYFALFKNNDDLRHEIDDLVREHYGIKKKDKNSKKKEKDAE